jgi:hypothetical protein
MLRVIGDFSPSYLSCKGCDQGRVNLGLGLHPKRCRNLIKCEYCKEDKESSDFETINGKRSMFCKECEVILQEKEEYLERRRGMKVDKEVKESVKEDLKAGSSLNFLIKKYKLGAETIREIRKELYNELEKEGQDLPKCKCGLSATHKGRCKFRRGETIKSPTSSDTSASLVTLRKDSQLSYIVNIVSDLALKIKEAKSLCLTLETLKRYGAELNLEKADLPSLLNIDSLKLNLEDLLYSGGKELWKTS